MSQGGGDKKLKPEEIEELFKFDQHNWEDLYKDHSSAHAVALESLYKSIDRKSDEGTTELGTSDIIKALASYLHAHRERTGEALAWDDMKEYQQHIYESEAHSLIRESAKANKMPVGKYMGHLKTQGLEELLNSISVSEKKIKVEKYSDALVRKHVSGDDFEKWKEYLEEHNPTLIADVDKAELEVNLKDYVRAHLVKYHDQSRGIDAIAEE